MMRELMRFLFLLLIAAVAAPHATLARAEDHAKALEKILNPLPEFDPFEKPPAPPQFFPDEVDKRARAVLVDALTNRPDALREQLKFFQAADRRLSEEHGTVTGLTDHVKDLANNTIEDRERYLAALKESLKDASSPERKKYLEAIINGDDLNQATQLMRRSSANEWGGVLNRLLSSVDLVGVASGNYIGAAAETVVSQAYALANRDMPIEQRRALVRDMDHLKRYPNDPHRVEIAKQVEELEAKKKNALVKKQLNQAKEAAAKGDLRKALFHAEIAYDLDPESKDTGRALKNFGKLQQEQDAGSKKGLVAKVEKPLTAKQPKDERRLLQSLSLREPLEIERAVIDIEKKHPDKKFLDSAHDAEAVAMEMRGHHEQAKKLIERIARSAEDPGARDRAAVLLESPQYNLLASLHEAQSQRRLESVEYVLLGENLLKKNLLYAAGAMAAAGPAGAATLGAANALMIGNNLIKVLSDNPISAQPIIDAGVAYVRSHPQSDNAAEVYKVIADAYEEKGMFDKAIRFNELAGTPKDEIDSLKEKAAKALLNAAAKSADRGSREYYLTRVIDEFPESPAAAEATRKLAELARSETHGVRMSKQFLIENPELYGPDGLGLKSSLFDGDLKNMELADRGASLTGSDELLLYFQTPWGVRSQNYALPRRTAERFFVALRRKNHDVAIADVNRRAKGSVGGIKNLPMPILRGEREQPAKAGDDDGDTTFSFVREAGGAGVTYPKVLDYELLSENERNPGSKYKLPPIHGSISASQFSMTGALPTGLWGNEIALGGDHRSPFAGVELPIPLLEGFIPVDFMVQGRPGGVSVYPRIHMDGDQGEDPELYR
jgi:hypothetical protein